MFADALLGAGYRARAIPGVWNPEDLLALPVLSGALAKAGIRITDPRLEPATSTAA